MSCDLYSLDFARAKPRKINKVLVTGLSHGQRSQLELMQILCVSLLLNGENFEGNDKYGKKKFTNLKPSAKGQKTKVYIMDDFDLKLLAKTFHRYCNSIQKR